MALEDSDPRDEALTPTTNSALAAAAIGASIAFTFLCLRFDIVSPLIPGAIAGLLFGSRFPIASIVTLFAMTGAIGTTLAFTPIPPAPAADLLLLGLWIGVAGRYVAGGWRGRLWLWPGVLAPGLYIAMSFLLIPLADPPSIGIEAIRNSVWYMLALVLLVVAPWNDEALGRLEKGLVAVTAIIGAYCAYRYFGTESFKETVEARRSQPNVPASQPLRFFGSQPSAQQLASFFATTAPFALALGLSWSGRWRVVALAAVAFGLIAILASDIRTGIAAVAGGIAVVILLFLISGAFRRRVHVGLVVLVGVVAMGAGGYSVTVATSDQQADRFENLLNPGEDYAFSVRERRWAEAIDEIEAEPLGYGLGTQGSVAYTMRDTGPVGPQNIDSSYLKIGIEQGVIGLALFAFGLLALLFGLIRRGVTDLSPKYAAAAIGAAGSLVAYALSMYGSTYVESLTALSAWIIIGAGVARTTHQPSRSLAEQSRAGTARGGPVMVGRLAGGPPSA